MKKEAAKKAKEEAEKQAQDDKARQWPENQLYLLVKPADMSTLDAFKPDPCQPDAIGRKPRGFVQPA